MEPEFHSTAETRSFGLETVPEAPVCSVAETLVDGFPFSVTLANPNGGGTILYTARCKEFTTDEGVAQAVRTCRYAGIDGVIAIGGDGTFRGAQKLSAAGVNTVGVPATIDTRC